MNNEAISSKSIGATSVVNHVNWLNLGLDVHYRQVTVAMQEDGGRIKAAGIRVRLAFTPLPSNRSGSLICPA
jgi:hypothetical protein